MTSTRMLLSHNFDMGEGEIPALSREEFTAVFQTGLADCAQCRLVDNPHWIVEVIFDSAQWSPLQMGDRYVQALRQARQHSLDSALPLPHVLALGGLKSTPTTSASPDALQINQWGVDIVETPNADGFLTALGWETAIADRAPETVFKAVLT